MAAERELNQILSTKLTLSYKDWAHSLDKQTFAEWLILNDDGQKLSVDLDASRLKDYLGQLGKTRQDLNIIASLESVKTSVLAAKTATIQVPPIQPRVTQSFAASKI